MDAIDEAMRTAGRSVVFAGVTVMISLLGLLLVRLSFLTGLAWGTATAVAVAVVGCDHAPAGAPVARRHSHRQAARRPAQGAPTSRRISARWSKAVSRRPVRSAVIGGGVLVALALPALGMRLAVADAGNDPVGHHHPQRLRLARRRLRPRRQRPADDRDRHPDRGRAPPKCPRSSSRSPTRRASRSSSRRARAPTAGSRSSPRSRRRSPQSAATEHLVHHLRHDLPDNVHIGGQTAVEHRLLDRPRQPSALVHRRCALAELRAAADRVPQRARAAQGGHHEPAVDRRRLRRDGDDLPVGMVRQRVRCRRRCSHRAVGSDDALRDRLRSLHGLRGLPALVHP